MLGLFLIYFVGKAFYNLAHEYDKSRWGFAIAGVVSYYGGIFLSVVIIATIVEMNSPGYITESNDMLFSLLGIPFGILACWSFYTILKNNWSKRPTTQPNTLDGGMINSSDQNVNNP